MKKLLFILHFALNIFFCNGQIIISNPSFENDCSLVDAVPLPWIKCMYSPDTHNDTCMLPYPFLTTPFGKGFVGAGAGTLSMSHFESFSQNLICPLPMNSICKFTFCSKQAFGTDLFGKWQLYGGNYACDTARLLGVSQIIADSTWRQYSITFEPDSNWNYIVFVPIATQVLNCYLLMDNLSNIQIADTNFLNTVSSQKNIILGQCVQLSSTYNTNYSSNIVSYNWQSVPTGFNSTLANPGFVCPTETTMYILTARYSCGMFMSDTVIVNVTDTTNQHPPDTTAYQIPTLLTSSNSIWHISYLPPNTR